MKDVIAEAAVLENGLTVVVETLPEMQSAAFSLLLPCGSAADPDRGNGTAAVLSDWLTRGCGDLDNRGFSDALDRLGVQRSESVSTSHMIYGGVCLADRLAAALPLYGDLVQCPLLDEDEFEPCVAGVAHELQALDDDPRQRVMLELVRRYYPAPWGQPPEGTLADLEHLSPDGVRGHCERQIRPDGAILGIAGRVTLAEILPAVESAFGTWNGGRVAPLTTGERGPLRDHLVAESAQTQIGVAFDSVPYRDPDYFAAWAAVSVLSGGMSSRLFTEVREKRGLCYSVYATLSSLRDRGAVLCYAGTTSERAQETLDVLLAELERVQEGIGLDELQRAQALAKSSLVMQQESTSARAGSIARDWYHLGRVTTLSEIRNRIETLTVHDVVDYIRRHPPHPATILTIGPQPLR